jgi:hypothetical protein
VTTLVDQRHPLRQCEPWAPLITRSVASNAPKTRSMLRCYPDLRYKMVPVTGIDRISMVGVTRFASSLRC